MSVLPDAEGDPMPPKRPSSAAPTGRRDLGPLVAGPFQDVLPDRALAIGRYTVADHHVDLARLPQHPRRVFNVRHVLALVKRTTDFFGHRRGWMGSFLNRVNPYPYPFRRVQIESFDGTLISGWLGLQSSRRPGVVIVPGMFSSKDDSVHKGKAIRIWRRWNYNVLIIDLRGFGLSGDSPNTPGWKEAEDVLAAARFLYAFNNVSTVGVLAESLGATASLLAAAQEGLWEQEAWRGADEAGDTAMGPWHLPGAKPLVDDPDPETTASARQRDPRPVATGAPVRAIGAVFAMSPFADARAAVEHINRMPPRRDPFYVVQRLFIRLLKLRTGGAIGDFADYMAASAEHYGVDLETLYARSSVKDALRHVRCPTLILHADDDPTVPAHHALLLEAAVADREDVVVWRVPWGRHVEWDLLDRRWYWRVVSRFFGQWVGR